MASAAATTPTPQPQPSAGSSAEEPSSFLESLEGEISFFRSIMRARPIGMHRHFHVLSMRSNIHKDTGRWVAIEDLWGKLRKCYDLDALDAIDIEAEGYETPQTSKSTPRTIQSPSPVENLAAHPFFREEYALPFEPSFESIISKRRTRDTPSPPSSPERSPAPLSSADAVPGRPKGPRRRAPNANTGGNNRSRANLAGLIGGDSDSSALTQESGDEGAPSGSVVTATDGETVDGEEEDDRDQTPDTAATTKRPRKYTKKAQASAQSQSGRIRVPPGASASGSSSRPSKKRKR